MPTITTTTISSIRVNPRAFPRAALRLAVMGAWTVGIREGAGRKTSGGAGRLRLPRPIDPACVDQQVPVLVIEPFASMVRSQYPAPVAFMVYGGAPSVGGS